jgi:hypothetical protein
VGGGGVKTDKGMFKRDAEEMFNSNILKRCQDVCGEQIKYTIPTQLELPHTH